MAEVIDFTEFVSEPGSGISGIEVTELTSS